MEREFIDKLMNYMRSIWKNMAHVKHGALAKSDITFPQMVMLQIVYDKGACTVSEIAKILGITKSAVTGIADRLIKSKMISRVHGVKDRRRVFISLTEKGKRIVREIVNDRRRMLEKMFGCLTEAERRTYLRLIEKIYNSSIKK